MKKLIIALFFCLPCIASKAQAVSESPQKGKAKNTLSVGMEWYRFFTKYSYSYAPFSVWHFSYARHIHKDWSVKANYSFWRLAREHYYPPHVEIENNWDITIPKGTKYRMTDFNYADIELCYHLSIKPKHHVWFSLGPSYLKAGNLYTDTLSYIIRPDGSIHYINITSTNDVTNYLGVVAGTGYNYSLCPVGCTLPFGKAK